MSVCRECCMCHVEVSATDRSLVQRNPAECGVSEFNRESSMATCQQAAVEPV
jgi:hypothetical protein